MPPSGPFLLYWELLGLPLSRAKGWAVDQIPFSLVETTVWTGLGCLALLGLAASTGRWQALRRRTALFFLILAGPVILLLLSLGQGAFPLSMAPSAWREPLAESYSPPPLPYTGFKEELRRRENRLHGLFRESYYASLSEEEALVGCDTLLDRVLERMELPPGRTVRKVKEMGPFTSLLGLSYGGPAFHDPFYGELAMVNSADLPTPKYWRLLGVCHEAAHAKGFTREMDAEILTQLALALSPDPRYALLADIMYLRKSGEPIHLPPPLRREILAARDSLRAVQARQPAVRFLRDAARRLGFQNSGGKYGTRSLADEWKADHPFYATVSGLLPRIAGGRAEDVP
jgi:hypothetical protein